MTATHRDDLRTKIPATEIEADFGICRKTLKNWQKKGLRTFRIGGRLYTSEAALMEFMEYPEAISATECGAAAKLRAWMER